MRGKGVSERSNRKFTTLRVGVTSLAVFVLLDDLHDRFLLSFFSSSNHSLERLLYHLTNSRTMICTRSPRIEMMRKSFLRDGEEVANQTTWQCVLSSTPRDTAICSYITLLSEHGGKWRVPSKKRIGLGSGSWGMVIPVTFEPTCRAYIV